MPKKIFNEETGEVNEMTELDYLMEDVHDLAQGDGAIEPQEIRKIARALYTFYQSFDT